MESSSGSDVAKPGLIHKLEGSTDEIHGAVVIPGKKTEGPNVWQGKVVSADRINQNSFDCTNKKSGHRYQQAATKPLKVFYGTVSFLL